MGGERFPFRRLGRAIPRHRSRPRQREPGRSGDGRERTREAHEPLTHDAYLKLSRYQGNWEGRRHFLGVAAKAVRRILSDRARDLRTNKRGGAWKEVTLDAALPGRDGDANACDRIELDAALRELAEADERSANIVAMRFLSGMTVQEVAASLGISETTVKVDWRAARAWLQGRLTR